jgi:hypothetical protein
MGLFPELFSPVFRTFLFRYFTLVPKALPTAAHADFPLSWFMFDRCFISVLSASSVPFRNQLNLSFPFCF